MESIVCADCGTFGPRYGKHDAVCKPCKVRRNREANQRMRARLGDEEYRRRSREATRRCRQSDFRREIWRRAKDRAKAHGLEFDLAVEDLAVPEKCPVLGIPLLLAAKGLRDHSASVDRIDNSLGYVKGNVVVVSWRANRIKTDATVEELGLVYRFYKEKKWRA